MVNRTASCLLLATLLAAATPGLLVAQGRPSTPAYQAPITEALVYPDRALVTRSSRLHLNPGKHTLLFPGAPAALDADSLRAFSDSDKLIVQGIRRRLERRNEAENPEVRRLQEQIRKLERSRDEQREQSARLRLDLGSIDRYAQFLNALISRQAPAAGEDPGRWGGAYRTLLQRRMNAQTEIQKSDETAARLEDQLGILRGNLEQLRSQAGQNYSVVEITVQSLAAEDSNLGFSYVIPGASWNVSYALHLGTDGKVRIEYYGVIRQETGEDWRNVSLSLSTAQPARGARRDFLRPLYISAREVQTRTEFAAVEDARAQEQNVIGGEAPLEQQTGGLSELERSGESVIFRIPRRSDVPSSRESRRVMIAEFTEAPTESYLHYAGALQLTPALALKLRNSRNFPLLSGPAEAFRNSGFVGRSTVRYTAPGASFNAGLGADRSVKTLRSLSRRREDVGPLTSDHYFYTRVELTLENESQQPQRMRLYERAPVSDVASVKVDLLPETTAGAEETERGSGVYRWNVELRPGEKKTVIMHYRVRAPAEYPGDIYGS
ncbi:MAG: mucoidy inhibitor MuiA family protein [Leptospirales bacterium]|nr:mucoidy inhibitor MuiA family protein [Leptospirales bacterium]